MNSGDLTTSKLTVTGVNSEVLLTVQAAANQAAEVVQIQNSSSSPLLGVSQNYTPTRGLAWDVVTGRLGLTSGYPDNCSDQLAQQTLYWTPWMGIGEIKLWNATSGFYEVQTFTELSLPALLPTASIATVARNATKESTITTVANHGFKVGDYCAITNCSDSTFYGYYIDTIPTSNSFTYAEATGGAVTQKAATGTCTSTWWSNSNYDIFICNNENAGNNNGTCRLGQIMWTNDTTRAATILNDGGYYYLSTAKGNRYVGTVRTRLATSALGALEDSQLNRFVWNVHNQIPKTLVCVYNPGTWTVTWNGGSSGTALVQPCNNGVSNSRVAWVQGRSGSVSASLSGYGQTPTWGTYWCSVGNGLSFDQTGSWAACQEYALNNISTGPVTMTTKATGVLTSVVAGDHWLVGLDYITSNGSMTGTWWWNSLIGWLLA